jgi:polyhydroxyalkanoate synthesis regulator phasin
MPTVGENANTAEDVLDVIYGAIEDGTIHLTQANQILCELKKPLELQNQQLRDKVNQSVRAK